MNTLLHFYGTWCGPCKVIEPIIKDIESTITVKHYDVDECDPDLLSKFTIKNIPALIYVDSNDKVLFRHIGTITKEELETKLNSANGTIENMVEG